MTSIVEKLVEKSKESFILAVEIYNKPTIKYRVESFSFLICNAWELMLKAYLIKTKGQDSIYYKNKPDRTISLENCIRLVFTNEKDPLRKNIERIIDLRNISTHYITEEYEQIYIPLFQSCAINYCNKLLDFFSIDVTQDINANFLTLSLKLSDIDENDIQARYPKQIAEKLMTAFRKINESIDTENNSNYAIPVRHEWYLTKNPKTATAAFSIAKNAEQPIRIIKESKDRQEQCPFTTAQCIYLINKRISRAALNFINPSAVDSEKMHLFNKVHFQLFIGFYSMKNDPHYCYAYNRNKQTVYSYSNDAIEFIIDEIKKDPEHIIQNLKNNIKK